MTKARDTSKEPKKKPTLNLREKRAAKKLKKDTKGTIQPLLPR